jgi:Glycosyltransferase family 87
MTTALPLRLSRDRVVVCGVLLALLVSSPFMLFPNWFTEVAYRGDFANFWSAGANAGSTALLHPAALFEWQRAHGITPQSFNYPPAFAWFYAPFSHLSPMAGMCVQDLCMIAFFIGAAWIASRIYAFPLWFAGVATFAWGPTINAIEVGQNAGLSVLLILCAIWALAQRRAGLAGLSIGLLLFKPSVALPFVLLLVVRAQWRALTVVAAMAAVWYVASAAALHGEWGWPAAYVRLVANMNAGEFAGNAHKAFTIPTLLMAGGASQALAVGVAVAIAIAAIPLLMRGSLLEAASLTSLLGVATSLHAWPYEAALLLPAVYYAMGRLREPARTRIVIAAYVIAACALSLPYTGHALALLTVGGTALWFWAAYRGAGSAVKRGTPLWNTQR